MGWIRTVALIVSLVVGPDVVRGSDTGTPTAVTGVSLPPDYRTWTAVAPSLRTDKGHIRMMLANPVMLEAYGSGTLPFPDGSKIVKLVYKAVQSVEWEGATVPGGPVSIEIMEKDSKRFADTGGWGFARFRPDGTPVNDMKLYVTCFPCHQSNVQGHDFVFTRWAP
ncbi:cytochrome P460 family protein [Deferrisoma camini]|uniref:cytochrome P460 family protein n=1 Tax=Deferrisoma camini TaxID=1035120 RepID=UPI00046D8EEA|nr:cytochrome P460 family protein [Deferrisoma camini]